MIARNQLNKLVVRTLRVSQGHRAVELYDILRHENPDVLRSESVRSFRSFVKIINSFPDVKGVGVGVKKYVIIK